MRKNHLFILVGYFMENKYEAIIVLSNLMDRFGNLNKESQLRTSKAAEIYQINPKAYLITSGWAYRKDTELTIATAFKNHLEKEHKIDPNNIFCEHNSRDTVGDAFFTRLNLFSKLKFKNIAVITSEYHSKRTHEIFDFVYGDSAKVDVITSKNLTIKEEILNKEKISTVAFRKTFKGIKKGELLEIQRRLVSNHPYYKKRI